MLIRDTHQEEPEGVGELLETQMWTWPRGTDGGPTKNGNANEKLGGPKNLVRGERGGRGKTAVQNLLWIFLGTKMMEGEIKTQILGGGIKYFLLSPLFGEDEPNLTHIFRWVETTN